MTTVDIFIREGLTGKNPTLPLSEQQAISFPCPHFAVMHSHVNISFFFFKSEFLSLSFPVAERGSFHGQVDLYTPATAQAGATVTLTLTVRHLDSPDANYAVAYLTVVPPVSSNSKLIGYTLYPCRDTVQRSPVLFLSIQIIHSSKTGH